ncbi:MAG: T9SS type A sorting domain-containing protein [Verrucomicrobia bacterium]|nr:T9SS type A sorting domain-containing protein [Cytophagales bacterium]
MKNFLSGILASLFCLSSQAQTPKDLTLPITVSFEGNPFKIVLNWNAIPGATAINISRKEKNSLSWGASLAVPATATSYTDASVNLYTAYEYRIIVNTSSISRQAFVLAGKELTATHKRGKVLLLIDETYKTVLATEILRLQHDLIGDGWQVIPQYIARNQPVTAVKNLIVNAYNADNTNLKAVFLLGRIPVPYSGNIYPDGHTPQHQGAWAADVYYADVLGNYTDSFVNISTASRAETRNIPGDGKFDNSNKSGNIPLQIGRVDLFNMPAFSSDDGLLVKRYLDKNHAFRFKINNPERKALIDDNFGYFGGEAFAINGWRNFYPLAGETNTKAGDYFTDMTAQSYMWAYGCGSGGYTGASGVGNTSSFVTQSVKNIFSMTFGSYFGDWDNKDNFLRAPLASQGWTLVSAWAGRPHWTLHQMALGETIGFCTQMTQNNSFTYPTNFGGTSVHIALMGDPTLRTHIVAPAQNFEASTIADSYAKLNWQAPSEAVTGYYVYRADKITDTFKLLTPTYLTSPTFTDSSNISIGVKIYMIRAVKLEETISGSYFNLSQGLIDSTLISKLPVVVTPPPLANEDPLDQIALFEVYPNPFNETLHLHFDKPLGKSVVLQLRNLLGKQVATYAFSGGSDFSVDVRTLPAGLYLLTLGSGNQNRRTVKILKIQ